MIVVSIVRYNRSYTDFHKRCFSGTRILEIQREFKVELENDHLQVCQSSPGMSSLPPHISRLTDCRFLLR